MILFNLSLSRDSEVIDLIDLGREFQSLIDNGRIKESGSFQCRLKVISGKIVGEADRRIDRF